MAERGRIVFRATPAAGSVRRVEGQFTRAARNLRSELIRELRVIEVSLEGVFEQYAPYDEDERDDYHLVDHIRATVGTVGQIRLNVSVAAISPQTGFDYLRVTRFGHRGPIVAKRGGRLRWRDGSGWHAAERTSGHRPASDWVEDARPEAEREVDHAAARLGRSISTRVFR